MKESQAVKQTRNESYKEKKGISHLPKGRINRRGRRRKEIGRKIGRGIDVVTLLPRKQNWLKGVFRFE